MALFNSSSPILKDSAYEGTIFKGMEMTESMTLKGTVNKFGFLFLMMMGTTFVSWSSFYKGVNVMPMMLIGVFGGLALALIMAFKKQWSSYLAPAYALCEGLFVGAVSAYYDYAFKDKYPGLVMQAVLLTLVVAVVMFLIYKYRIIKVTEKFRAVMSIAIASIAIFYLAQWVYYLITGTNFAAFTNAATPLGIGFSVVVVCIAALTLLMNFDTIEKGIEMKAPKFMEWYSAFGLLVTLVWLYLEILRLLSKLSKR
jgi:uncharacterized YccA/Bax inhibitor family protein